MRANALMSSSFPLYGYLYWGKAGITPFKGKKKSRDHLVGKQNHHQGAETQISRC